MNDLDQLKELLFGAEKEALNSIADRIGRREVRTIDVAEVLPEAIEQSYQKDGGLVDALTQPVGDCVQRGLHEEPDIYADALYPVMGPAIRKSIMHALRNFSQQINEAVEHSVTPRGLKWRWQASRAGVPFGEYVMQQTLRYRIEQAYLISRENGLLVGHVHHEASKIKDSDAVSAMFTAIQDFVKESFSPDRTGRLESADMGDFTLWAVHGPHALLVCVIRGVPPKRLRADLSAILERIHFRYGEAIRDYKGDTATVPDVEVELERCLRFEAREEAEKKHGGLPPWLLVLLLLLGVAAIFLAFKSYSYSQQLERLNAALASAPGIHVSSAERDRDHFSIVGLRDPLAASVADVARSANIPAERISASLQPFQSLQPEIVIKRAEQRFGPPDSVRFELDGTTLRISGDASAAWLAQLEDGYSQLVGIDKLDSSGLDVTDAGGATAEVDEPRTLAERIADISGKRFYFDSGTAWASDSENELREYAARLDTLQREAVETGDALLVVLTGSTDSVGDDVANVRLAERRAAIVAAALADSGVVAEIARLSVIPESSRETQEDASKRHVQVDLELRSAPTSR